jgi:hypothetical protein
MLLHKLDIFIRYFHLVVSNLRGQLRDTRNSFLFASLSTFKNFRKQHPTFNDMINSTRTPNSSIELTTELNSNVKNSKL